MFPTVALCFIETQQDPLPLTFGQNMEGGVIISWIINSLLRHVLNLLALGV